MNEMCINREEVEKIVRYELATTNATISGQFNLMSEKLGTIANVGEKTLQQAIKTNGRVDKLEHELIQVQDNMEHPEVACPFKEPIRKLQDESLTAKAMVKTIWQVAAALGALITISITILGFILANS